MQVGDDVLKQKQLVEAVAAQFSGAKKVQSAEAELREEVAELVLSGVIDLFRVMDQQRENSGSKQGRLPHELKIARDSIQVAVSNQIPPGKVAAVARVLQMNRDQLRVARALFGQFKSGEVSAPYQAPYQAHNR